MLLNRALQPIYWIDTLSKLSFEKGISRIKKNHPCIKSTVSLIFLYFSSYLWFAWNCLLLKESNFKEEDLNWKRQGILAKGMATSVTTFMKMWNNTKS